MHFLISESIDRIDRLYTVGSFWLLGLGLLLVILPYDSTTYLESAIIATVFNLGYHMTFHFISILYYEVLIWVERNGTSQIAILAKFMVLLFAYALLLGSYGFIAFLIIRAFVTFDFSYLTPTPVLAGPILGTNKLILKLKSKAG